MTSVGAGLRVEQRDGVAWLTLNRPPLNLMTPEMVAALKHTFDRLHGDEQVRAAVISGAGRVMTGGMQIEVLRDLTPSLAKAFITRLHEAIRAVHEAPFPTVCMMNGHCLGAG